MLCLGIESSCDETALALISNGRLLDSVLASQARLHALFGGVVPELASREHCRYMGPLFDQLLGRNNMAADAIDVVAVARGPGLLGSLLVGVGFAKALALALGKPLIGINHLHAHLLALGIEHKLEFPALGLLVSGGHTHIYRINSPQDFQQLGASLDDAAGEAFDKVGKALGLSYPAGRQMDELAGAGKVDPDLLPRPYLDNDNLDFSFSGLKTAAIALIRQNALDRSGHGGNYSEELKNFCASFNFAVAETLRVKAERALDREKGLDALWLAGGVAANSMIRQTLAGMMKKKGGRLLVPDISLCADNGAMIAYAGYELASKGYYHGLEMETVPRGKKIPCDMLRAPACRYEKVDMP